MAGAQSRQSVTLTMSALKSLSQSSLSSSDSRDDMQEWLADGNPARLGSHGRNSSASDCDADEDISDHSDDDTTDQSDELHTDVHEVDRTRLRDMTDAVNQKQKQNAVAQDAVEDDGFDDAWEDQLHAALRHRT